MTQEGSEQGRQEEVGSIEPRIILGWEFSERPDYRRGIVWYILAGVTSIGLLIYAIWTANFLFALLILLFALVIYLNSSSEPRTLRMAIREDGVAIGREFIPYSGMSGFRIVYEPPLVQSVYLQTTDLFRGELAVEITDLTPNDIRPVLSKFLKEDKINNQPSTSEILSKILKI